MSRSVAWRAGLCAALLWAGAALADDPVPLYREPGEELVKSVESLSAQRVASLGNVVRVTASGTARMAEVSQAKLLPFPGRTPPADGMYEFAFTVVPASGDVSDRPGTVTVAFDWFGVPDTAVGIRVRAGANVMEARIEPSREGFDPAVLIGRRLVEAGEPGPGDVSPDQLPEPYAIVRPSEPQPSDQRPDRLVIVLDAAGTIRDAALR